MYQYNPNYLTVLTLNGYAFNFNTPFRAGPHYFHVPKYFKKRILEGFGTDALHFAFSLSLLLVLLL